MTKATEITTFLKIVINRQDLTTERIETAYIFLLEGLVKKGKTRSPVGWASILTTPLEWTLLQVSNTCLPAGPFQPPSTPADASIYPGAENQHQISPAKRYWTTSKKIWKELCNSEEGCKETWIEACDDNVLDELQDPLLGFGSFTLSKMVTFIFDEYSVLEKFTRKQLREMMTDPWTGGRIQQIFKQINRAATTYTRHNVILREDKKVNIVVKVI